MAARRQPWYSIRDYANGHELTCVQGKKDAEAKALTLSQTRAIEICRLVVVSVAWAGADKVSPL